MNEAMERQASIIDTCVSCPRLCRWACPVAEAEGREGVSPHAQVSLAGWIRGGRVPPEAAGDIPFHCTQCYACTSVCLHENDAPWVVAMARTHAGTSAAGQAAAEVRGHFGVAGNPEGRDLETVLEVAAAAAGTEVERRGEALYLPGCEVLAHEPRLVTRFLRAIRVLGLSPLAVSPASARCCGLPLLWAGDGAAFEAHARRFAEAIEGFDRIVCHDPGCAVALERHYARVGAPIRPKVETLADYLAGQLDRLPERRDGGPVRILAGCQQTHGLGRTEALKLVCDRVLGGEGKWAPGLEDGELACCGAGGLLPATAPTTSADMARARLADDGDAVGGRALAASPRCARHLRQHGGGADHTVMDLVGLLDEGEA